MFRIRAEIYWGGISLLFYHNVNRFIFTAFAADRNSDLTGCSAGAKNRLCPAKVCQVLTAAKNLGSSGSCAVELHRYQFLSFWEC